MPPKISQKRIARNAGLAREGGDVRIVLGKLMQFGKILFGLSGLMTQNTSVRRLYYNSLSNRRNSHPESIIETWDRQTDLNSATLELWSSSASEILFHIIQQAPTAVKQMLAVKSIHLCTGQRPRAEGELSVKCKSSSWRKIRAHGPASNVLYSSRLPHRGTRGCNDSARLCLPPNTLSLTFNGHTFSTLSAVLEHAQDYTVGEERIHISFENYRSSVEHYAIESGSCQGPCYRDLEGSQLEDGEMGKTER